MMVSQEVVVFKEQEQKCRISPARETFPYTQSITYYLQGMMRDSFMVTYITVYSLSYIS